MEDVEGKDTRTLTVGPMTTSTAHKLLYYDGACNNIHGHNMEWEGEITVTMEGSGMENMPVDFKHVSDLIDRFDHALILNYDDPLMETHRKQDVSQPVEDSELGPIYWTEDDPTSEKVVEMVAQDIVSQVEPIIHIRLSLAETSKYTVTTEVWDD
jgi:6-pyruvoyl-tetrahydropterin synthase